MNDEQGQDVVETDEQPQEPVAVPNEEQVEVPPSPVRILALKTDGCRVETIQNTLTPLELASVARMLASTAEQLIAKGNSG